jgi:hypothetical protein
VHEGGRVRASTVDLILKDHCESESEGESKGMPGQCVSVSAPNRVHHTVSVTCAQTFGVSPNALKHFLLVQLLYLGAHYHGSYRPPHCLR